MTEDKQDRELRGSNETHKPDDQLSDIKEVRRLMQHTINTLNKLDAGMADINRRVNRRDHGENTRFFATFIVLTVVIILAFFFYFRSATANYSDRYAVLEQHKNYLQKEVADLKEKISAIENGDIKAYNLYLALKEGDPDYAFKLYGEFNLSSLSRLERTIIENETSLIKQKAAIKKYEEGDVLFKRKSYEAAVGKFKESLDISSTGDHVPTMFYLTSLAYYRMKDYNKAAISFERFLFINTKKDFQKDRAELLLGVCYEKMNQLERAKNFYIQSMKENRYNRYYPTIRDRLANIEKKLAKQQQQKDVSEL